MPETKRRKPKPIGDENCKHLAERVVERRKKSNTLVYQCEECGRIRSQRMGSFLRQLIRDTERRGGKVRRGY